MILRKIIPAYILLLFVVLLSYIYPSVPGLGYLVPLYLLMASFVLTDRINTKTSPSPQSSPSRGEDASKTLPPRRDGDDLNKTPPLRGGDEGEGDFRGFTHGHIHAYFSVQHLMLAAVVSVLILLPVYFVMSAFVGPWRLLPLSLLLHQLIMVAFPEEIFFRGFFQESLGNNTRAVISVSILFAVAHMPAFLFQRDPSALFTFFPSLVMGFLYLRTGNVVPSIVFHFLSNVVYLGFMI